ncbi:MAG: DUF3098 domain-containing protein [Saprospiraceae bacterium]|jgi:hypothetical protein|nr:DUF3098 domain-containing protein [Saprospiraceae bacterium]MBP9209707.1 DUF3098 domain-containing protein [Saprospiraceae bacterium]MBV6474118.1 hypothetical protein [Saprospiraceae bacterium]
MGEAQRKKSSSKPTAAPAAKVHQRIQAAGSVTYGRTQYLWMLAGVACIVLGLILMLGGGMPDAETWDESLIYSHRRLTLAPLMIVIGLGLQVFAIFKVRKPE